MMHDTATFGGFCHSLLQSFRDEFRKVSVMSFAILSNSMPSDAEVGHVNYIPLFCLVVSSYSLS